MVPYKMEIAIPITHCAGIKVYTSTTPSPHLSTPFQLNDLSSPPTLHSTRVLKSSAVRVCVCFGRRDRSIHSNYSFHSLYSGALVYTYTSSAINCIYSRSRTRTVSLAAHHTRISVSAPLVAILPSNYDLKHFKPFQSSNTFDAFHF